MNTVKFPSFCCNKHTGIRKDNFQNISSVPAQKIDNIHLTWLWKYKEIISADHIISHFQQKGPICNIMLWFLTFCHCKRYCNHILAWAIYQKPYPETFFSWEFLGNLQSPNYFNTESFCGYTTYQKITKVFNASLAKFQVQSGRHFHLFMRLQEFMSVIAFSRMCLALVKNNGELNYMVTELFWGFFLAGNSTEAIILSRV